jgi:hypothetical protein
MLDVPIIALEYPPMFEADRDHLNNHLTAYKAQTAPGQSRENSSLSGDGFVVAYTS